jgi:hypothetical protein
MNRRDFLIWLIAGVGLYLLGSGLNGMATYEQTCCFPSPFCEEVMMCDFTKSVADEREEISKNLEFIITGLMMLILLLVLYENTEFFRK